MADGMQENLERKSEMADVMPKEQEGNSAMTNGMSGERERNGESMEGMDGEKEKWKKRGGRRKADRHLTGSLVAKVAAFFLLVASLVLGAGSTVVIIAVAEYGFFTESQDAVLMDALWGNSVSAVYEVMGYLSRGEVGNAEIFCRNHNIDIEMCYVDEVGQAQIIWNTWSGYDSDMDISGVVFRQFSQVSKPVTLNRHTLKAGEDYLFRIHIDPDFPLDDDFRTIADFIFFLYENWICIFCLGLGGIFLFLVCFIFLMSSAGHRNGCKGIVPGVLTGIHLDVLTLFFGGTAMFFTYIMWELFSDVSYYRRILLFALWGIVMAIWMTIFFMDFALRLKLGKCWKHTLVYSLFRGIWRILRLLGKGVVAMARGIPLVFATLLGFFGSCILEFIGMGVFARSPEGFWCWFLVKLALLVVIMYIALTCKKLLAASRALSEGQENYKVDTSRMFGDFREHGENLNSLGEGIAKAVAERMKSEHLKTELITNVSHDIKTPLTSIINYADLIYEESAKAVTSVDAQAMGGIAGQGVDAGRGADALQGADAAPAEADGTSMDRIQEYSQVLLRQSRRMKKLLEDLVEASKATTGNLEVNLEPCEAGVLLSQAVGEYQRKMEEKGLELVARQPEEPVKIMADGRHLWRVFDNLLNNICKYAQESTRVYLSLEMREGHVLIIFRNMSKYALDISGDELEERFARGDRSRHMEGNGLGLSIAKSLVELQNGRMEIVIDGDLFKVILSFPIM